MIEYCFKINTKCNVTKKMEPDREIMTAYSESAHQITNSQNYASNKTFVDQCNYCELE